MIDPKISKTEDNPVIQVSDAHTVSPRVNEAGIPYSIVVSTINGTNPKMMHKKSTWSYLIIDGEVTFHIDENNPITLTQGDTITLPPETIYYFEGNGSFYTICDPPFTPEDDFFID